jgi:hypothetical protein
MIRMFNKAPETYHSPQRGRIGIHIINLAIRPICFDELMRFRLYRRRQGIREMRLRITGLFGWTTRFAMVFFMAGIQEQYKAAGGDQYAQGKKSVLHKGIY